MSFFYVCEERSSNKLKNPNIEFDVILLPTLLKKPGLLLVSLFHIFILGVISALSFADSHTTAEPYNPRNIAEPQNIVESHKKTSIHQNHVLPSDKTQILLATTLELPSVEISTSNDHQEILSTQDLLNLPGSGNDPLKAIYALPGVTFVSDISGMPAIRGSSPLDNAYEFDGFPVEYLFHFDGSSLLNEHIVEEFNLYPSTFNHRFQDATGSAIEAYTRLPTFETGLTGIWDMSLLKTGLLIESGLGNDDGFFLSLRHSLLYLFAESLIENHEFELRTFPRFFDYQGKYHKSLDHQQSLTVNISGAKDSAEIFVPEDSDIVTEEPDLQGEVSSDARFHQQGMVYQSWDSEGNKTQWTSNHLYTDFESTLGQAGQIAGHENQWWLRREQYKQWNHHHEMYFNISYLLKNVDYRLDFQNSGCTDIEPHCLTSNAQRKEASDQIDIHNLDVTLQDHWDLSSRWQLISALHFDYDDYLKDLIFEPRFSLHYNLSNTSSIHWGIGRYHRFPKGQEIIQIIETFGNPELKQSKATHYEIGYKKFFSDTLSLSSNLYFKSLKDLVISDTSLNYSNNAKGTASGLELLLNKSLNKQWQGWLSLTLSKTERINLNSKEKYPFEYDQPIILNLMSQYRFLNRFVFGAKWRYQSGRLITPVVRGEQVEGRSFYTPVYGQSFSERLGYYSRLDLRLDMDFSHRRNFKMYIELINVLNRDNPTGYDYSPDFSNKEEIHQLPFIPSIGMQGSF